MADFADDAQRAEDMFLAQALSNVGGQSPFKGAKTTGFCIWCDEPIPAGKLHCTPAENGCEEDHAKHLRQKGDFHGR